MGYRPVGRERQDAVHMARSCFACPRDLQAMSGLTHPESERPRFIASLGLAPKLSLREEMKITAAQLNLNSKTTEETPYSLERTLEYQRKCVTWSRKLCAFSAGSITHSIMLAFPARIGLLQSNRKLFSKRSFRSTSKASSS